VLLAAVAARDNWVKDLAKVNTHTHAMKHCLASPPLQTQLQATIIDYQTSWIFVQLKNISLLLSLFL
jgi:hypothetical protein